MNALIIGGTRNLGPSLAQTLLDAGYRVSVFNRGITPGVLPQGIERLHGDRSKPEELEAALAGREFDLVVDTTLYNGPDAEAVIRILDGRVGHYIFISTGQVYLVRVGVDFPYREEDYDGAVMPDPGGDQADDHSQHAEWLYGVDKRAAEDALHRAWHARRFPFTTLRLPMVNSELDHHDRIYGYWLRLNDGGPIVIPSGEALPLRHVYGGDVNQAVMRSAQSDAAKGQAFNISQDITYTIDAFLAMLANLCGKRLRLKRVPRERLEELGLLPACSPFSGRWMSVIANVHSKLELGMVYTPPATYLERIIAWHASKPVRSVAGYARRAEELQL